MSSRYTPVSDLFNIYAANSKSFSDYSGGSLPYVSNGFYNNGVLGYVDPYPSDRIFKGGTIPVSAFCEAIVQKEDYLPRGNGGSGLIVLEPKTKMDYLQLSEYAAIINCALRWKYSYGRMVTKGRFLKESLPAVYISSIVIPNVNDIIANISNDYSPAASGAESSREIIINGIQGSSIANMMMRVPITELFELQHGDFHSIDALSAGPYPTVSRVDRNNGVVGLFEAPDGAVIYEPPSITVSTVSGDVFVQLEKFIATDNVVICTPKMVMEKETIFFAAVSLSLEKWRWSYGRQCYKNRFSKTEIFMPMRDGSIDEPAIKEFIAEQWGWGYIERFLRG